LTRLFGFCSIGMLAHEDVATIEHIDELLSNSFDGLSLDVR